MLSPSTYFSFAWISVLRVHDGDRISLKDTIPPWATCKGLPLLKWSKSWTSDEIFILSHIYNGDDCGASTCIFEGYNAQMCPFDSVCLFSHGKFDQRETEKSLYHTVGSPYSVSVLRVKHVMPVEDFNDLFPTLKLLISETWLPPSTTIFVSEANRATENCIFA